MENIINILSQGNTTSTLIILSAIICIGTLVGKIKIGSLSIGIIAILFVGMASGIFFNKTGIAVNSTMTGIFKDFGLLLFIYTIGLQVGPSFFEGFKKGGFRLNLQAVAIVILGIVITLLISFFSDENPEMLAGIYSGSISSTPGLSAAQETISNLGRGNADAIAMGYAITYPIGVIIPILCCVVIRRVCKVKLNEEFVEKIDTNEKSLSVYNTKDEKTTGKTIIVIFAGILLGLGLGSISINIPINGFVVPMKLGNTGGALVVAIIISHTGTKLGWIDSSVTNNAGTKLLREVGIAIFLALVGLTAGSYIFEMNLIESVKWILYGLIIAILPTLIVGLFARLRHKTNFFTLMGMIGGATTDTPALAYANNVASNSNNGLPAAAYASVYPLTVFLRMVTAQILVLFIV